MKIERRKDGSVEALRIASWGNGVSLWRSPVQRSTIGGLQISNPRFRRFSLESGREYSSVHVNCVHREAATFEFTFYDKVATRKGKISQTESAWPYLRWAMVELGLAKPFQMLPLQTPHGTDLDPTPNNPFIGRFRGRTTEEVKDLLAAYDRQISTLSPGYIQILADDLFENNAEIWLHRIHTGEIDLLAQWKRLDGLVRDLAGRRFPTLVSALPWFMGDHLPEGAIVFDPVARSPSWRYLPTDDAERWWVENTRPGKLELPADEVELYQMLGEPIPFLWPDDHLLDWLTERGVT